MLNARSAVIAYSEAYILVCCALVWVSLKIFSIVRLLWHAAHSLWLTIHRRVCQRVCALVLVSIMCIELEKIKVISFKFQTITVYNLLWLSEMFSVHLDIGHCLSSVQSADRSAGALKPSRAVIFLMHDHAD